MQENKSQGSYPPWSRIPSLTEMTAEAGIDLDTFIRFIQTGYSPDQMAEYFQVSHGTIESLQEHFFRYGISSVMGGD
ncbi:MAG: helix-turn-helix domain-containing protein [Syntrophomonadaceae bacterium]